MPRATKSSKHKKIQQKLEQKLGKIMQRVAYFSAGYGVETMRFTRNRLENIGSGIESINKKTSSNLNYLPAEFTGDKGSLFTENPFVEHTIKSTSKIFGKEYNLYKDVLKKLRPDAVDADLENVAFDKSVNNVTDTIFEQIARFAYGWSKLHLSDERRFNLHMMTDAQRNTVARDIANQNRALATLGGVASGKGLIGMFIDSIWLLVISLRVIYQLSAVYDKPLRGKEGIQTAYAIIASSDLGKMHDKQSLIAGLGIAQTLLDTIESEGIKYSLKKELNEFNKSDNNAEKSHASSHYTQKIRRSLQQIENLSSQFNLEFDDLLSYINFNKIQKIIPLVSATTGAYYNSQLIEQIIGTTQATFAPELKVVKEVHVHD